MANHPEETSFAERQLEALEAPGGFQPNAARARIGLQGRIVQHSGRRRRRQRWTTAAAVAGVLTLAAVLSSPRAAASESENGSVSWFESLMPTVHFVLVAHWNHILGVLYGVEAPDFTLTGASGNPVQLSSYRGKVVLLHFWATGCASCDTEMATLMELQRSFGDDLVVLGVSIDADGWSAVRPFIRRHGITFPVILRDPDMARMYRKVDSVPTTMWIGRDGRIARTQEEPASLGVYETWVRDLLPRRLQAR